MARDRGRDNPARGKKARALRREVFVYTEGEVTEPGFVTYVMKNGERKEPRHQIVCTVENRSAPSKRRKPLPLVEEAVGKWQEVQRAAKKASIKPDDWNWPQVWCLFDRDEHKDIPTAFARAKHEGVHVAYSHPCFELWRLLHYQNYTSRLGGVCNSAANALRRQDGFPQTYGPSLRTVTDQQAKQVMAGQLDGRYETARRHAQRLNARHEGRTDQNQWDPFTDVWRFVEDGLDVSGY
ncbi:RloB family protein [Streptomyces sp. NBC_00483]|uniref:RloB family protein n=1 Tax=Streptomyces sp. NBC_00483 TaxID=2975756 RepID=UPI002E19342F